MTRICSRRQYRQCDYRVRFAVREDITNKLVFHNIVEAPRISAGVSLCAPHDALTGLLNRGEFAVQLGFLLDKTRTDNSEHALMLIDLDQFKLVNNSCGHAAGDLLLQYVTTLLAEVVGASGTVARLGGDEFAIILEHCAIPQALRLAELICERLENARFIHESWRFHIGVSIGLVQVGQGWQDPADVLRAAESACCAAKKAGRNRVSLWSETDQTMRVQQSLARLATQLLQALDEDRLVLFAQRILPLREEAGREDRIHAEVLLRILEQDGSLGSPGAFFAAAERFHMATRIDRWVLDRVITWMVDCPCLMHIETLSVNLSGQSVGDRAFHHWAIEKLTRAGETICRRICLEITETATITNLSDALTFITQVRTIGVRVALDDFGAGACSFSYLKTMQVDYLKIDGQFIRGLVSDPLDETAVRCFAEIASVAGLRTVAEFVDSPAVLSKLQLMGIDFAQGYLIHRPSPILELLELST